MGRNDNVATVRINGQPVPLGTYWVTAEQFKGCIDIATLTVAQESGDRFTGNVCTFAYTETLRAGTDIDATHVTVRDERCDGKGLKIESSTGSVAERWRQPWTACGVVASDPQRVLQQARKAVAAEQRARDAALKSMGTILGGDATRLEERLGQAMGGTGIDLGRPRRSSAPEVYFETAQATIRADEATKLDQVIRTHRQGGLIIEGHADVRGDAQANYALGLKRATAVKSYLAAGFQKAGKPVPVLTITSHGEGGARATTNADELARDRRVTIVSSVGGGTDPAKRVVLERGLAAVKGDVYLIDASGSMSDMWSAVQAYRFPKGSQPFSFNSCGGVTRGIIDAPNCDTPLWQSVLTMVQQIPDRKTLTVVTDGVATDSEHIDVLLTLAKQKRIRINFVRIGGMQFGGRMQVETTDTLRRVAQETGGQYYVRQ